MHETYLQKTLQILTYVFNWLYFIGLTSFSSISHLLRLYVRFLILFYPSNIDEVLLINPSANVFAIGDFNLHHKDWLIFPDRIDRPGELCYNLKGPYSDG